MKMVEVLFVAWNRLEFTKLSFEMLLENTDWSVVSRLIVHDDGSEDGTTRWLRRMLRGSPVPSGFGSMALRSPPAVMNLVFPEVKAPYVAKIDNDIVVPPGWLEALLDVMERHAVLELLGMEAGRFGPPGHNGAVWGGVYGYEPCSHIGGVGLMRTEAFRRRPLIPERGRFGFTEWQDKHDPVRGWVMPDLLVSCLDMIPVEPWSSLSEGYIERGWQRPWPKYDPRWPYYWAWWSKVLS